jgi:hypothetical protein
MLLFRFVIISKVHVTNTKLGEYVVHHKERRLLFYSGEDFRE